MQSCLYQGAVTHRRRTPVTHAFRSQVWMALLDLGEVGELTHARGVLSTRRFALASFLQNDHLYEHRGSLESEVRSLVRAQLGDAPNGPVRLLTQLRCLGQYFSPLNLFFLHESAVGPPAVVVAEVNNTPWGERHCYVLDARQEPNNGAVFHFRHDKQMHVSPFMPMGLQYTWRITTPGERVAVALACVSGGRKLFAAALSMRRRPLTKSNLRRASLVQPAVGVGTLAAIYYQALLLWWKRCPFYPHPNSQAKTPAASA